MDLVQDRVRTDGAEANVKAFEPRAHRTMVGRAIRVWSAVPLPMAKNSAAFSPTPAGRVRGMATQGHQDSLMLTANFARVQNRWCLRELPNIIPIRQNSMLLTIAGAPVD